MKRREFITLLGGAAAWPLAARAQQTRSRTIGYLGATTAAAEKSRTDAFVQRLGELGWIEGHTVAIEYRWGESRTERFPEIAADLVQLQVDIVVVTSTAAALACKQATAVIPIVFPLTGDPLGTGLVASLARPGGNVTGFTDIQPTIAGKWLELLKEIAPRVARVAFLFNPVTAPHFEYYLNPFKAAAASFAVEAIAAPVRDKSDLNSVIAAQARAPNGGLIVMPDAFIVTHRAEITLLAARYRLPAVYSLRIFTDAGGLLSYGSDLVDNFRRAATYADRILKEAKPSELPVQAPVKFELAINLKTAKALALDVPWFLQQRADYVIE